MSFLIVLATISSVYHTANGFGFRGFHYEGLEEPIRLDLADPQEIIERWITQPLDHFNPHDNRTWSMRYYENSGHFKKGGPIFIMIGGEWVISPGYLQGGLMYEIATKHNGMMYYTEHRYYGKSQPTIDTSSDNLQFLNVDQALADLGYFIDTKRKEKDMQNSPVIVFGGSYAGNMAAWARLKYPHLIQGALASSAPVFAKADFYEYYEVVTRSIRRTSEECATDVKKAFDLVEELLAAKDGPQKLKTYFNLCAVPDVKSPSDIGYFMNMLAEKFASTVQYDKIVDGTSMIADTCKTMTAPELGSPLQRLASLISAKTGCTRNSYKDFLTTYRNVSWNSSAAKNNMRQWLYQTCTEYGYYQTTNSSESIFGSLFPLRYFTEMCLDLYGGYHGAWFLDTRVRRTNIMYGGWYPDLRNVIFTNGDIDPWHALSILKDVNEFSPAIVIKGSSHCRDLQSNSKADVEGLPEARDRVRDIIGKWLS